MKLKLSPFTILFLLLNSLLIFCATNNIDSGKERSTRLTDTKMETQADSDFNFDGYSNKNTNILGKPSHGFRHTINDKSDKDLKVMSLDDFHEDSEELKIEYFYSILKDSISKDQIGISAQISDKTDAIVNHYK